MPSQRTAVTFVVGLLVALSACANDTPDANSPTVPATAATSTAATPATPAASPISAPPTTAPPTTAPVAPACKVPSTTKLHAVPVAGSSIDYSITSFDGTVIRAHWFPVATGSATTQAPTILMGPGWGSGGDTNTENVGLLGALSIRTLWDAGYNVLTWDPRGFGASTGTVEIDSADVEARDVEQLIDWVATLPEVQVDAQRDPRMGMVGASYGGGIQLTTAAIDCRIDAIVPIIAWHSLTTSLFKANTPKAGWAGLLNAVSAGKKVDAHITSSNVSVTSSGTVSDEDAAWFASRGPSDLVAKIAVPTLVVQGTVDTLFTLDEAVSNYNLLAANKVPLAMLWFCGGHGICLTDPGDPQRLTGQIVGWLDRYVKGDDNATLVPGFELVDQDGVYYSADTYTESTGKPISASGKGTLKLVADGGAGPATTGPNSGVVGGAAAGITPAQATNSVDVKIDLGTTESLLVGAPTLTISYTGTTPTNDRPTRVFAQLVDDTTNVVLGNQITPFEVILDGTSHTTEVPLEMIAFTAKVGSSLTLQLVATTVAYAQPQLGGSIDFSAITIKLPVSTSMRVNPE